MATVERKDSEIFELRARVADLERQLAAAHSGGPPKVPTRGGEALNLDQLRSVFENYSGGMGFSRNGIVIDANVGLARMLHTTVEEIISRPIADMIAPEDRELVKKHIERGYTKPYEHRLLRKDGTTVPVEATASTIGGPGSTLRFTVIRDISDRKRAEEKLRAEQDFLQVLIKAHERDRQLMAYEIHDGLVQYITAALWHLESVSDRPGIDDESRATLTKSQELLRQALSEGRRLLSGLRPPVLDEQGILVALEYLGAENAVPGKLEIEIERNVQFQRLDSLLEGTIFRIVQESLNNVRKHAHASKAYVRLSEHGNRLQLTIEDDGRGFQSNAVPSDRFGLRGIRKRAELLGGSATIDSVPGKGTKVSVDLPLLQAPDRNELAT